MNVQGGAGGSGGGSIDGILVGAACNKSVVRCIKKIFWVKTNVRSVYYPHKVKNIFKIKNDCPNFYKKHVVEITN